MSFAPHGAKRRQYAAGESHVYYGSVEGQQNLTNNLPNESTPLPDASHNIDLMTYPPDPRDLLISPPEIRMPPGSRHLSSRSDTPMGSGYQSCTLSSIPRTESLLHDIKIPLGLVVSPYRTLAEGEEPVPIVDDGVIARCRECKGYINPYVAFLDNGRSWRCSLCDNSNEVPEAFYWTGIVNEPPRDSISRAELSSTLVDFVATAEYIRQAPQAPAYVFLLDVSQEAMKSGMFVAAIRTIRENLEALPNDQQRTKVAFVCYDVALYFFSLPPGADAFDMLVVSDLEATYIPRPQADLLVNLSDARGPLETLLQGLPAMFAGVPTLDSATGPALEGALALIGSVGGKIVLLSASVPTRGKGALDTPKHVSERDQKEPDADKSAAAFYHEFATSCIEACVSVDMFISGDRYRGLATLTLLPQYTAGQTFYYPAFSAADAEDVVKFAAEFGRVLVMPIMLEAEMSVRCSRGISVKSMHGNFFVQGRDRVVMPAISLDESYAIEFQIDESLTGPLAVFQTGLLHTTASGERRIRVLTLALATTAVATEVFVSADVRAIIALLAKQMAQRPSVLSLEDRRAKILRFLADLCAAYALSNNKAPSELALLLPANLKMLPIMLLGLFKRIAMRLDTETALDVRAYTRVLLTSACASRLIRYIYPNVYSLHNLPQDVGFISAEGVLNMPTPLPLTSAPWWEPHGLYLFDDGQVVYLWVGRAAVPQLITDVFGVEDYSALRSGKIALPQVDSAISQRIGAIIGKIRERRGRHYPSVYVVKDDSVSELRSAVVQMLIHDRVDDMRLSYRQFLVKIYGK
ncbi:CPII coat sec24 protein [Mycena belliarum]|uniref:CPII coat sec24 protein n=1 Tax=Mycena belliarum TaxID=1033014 RepID=A0AAD6UBB9_9AGAR|nr:CPII coat sec24 protein [Mycena belliae]